MLQNKEKEGRGMAVIDQELQGNAEKIDHRLRELAMSGLWEP